MDNGGGRAGINVFTGKIYRTVIRPTMIYGAESWALRKQDEQLLHRTEMKMLRRICGVTLLDKRSNDMIRRLAGVAPIVEKLREARLRWFGHVNRMDDSCVQRGMMLADVTGRRSRGRQKMRWMDNVRHDLQELKLTEDDALDRDLWRSRIRVADPRRESTA